MLADESLWISFYVTIKLYNTKPIIIVKSITQENITKDNFTRGSLFIHIELRRIPCIKMKIESNNINQVPATQLDLCSSSTYIAMPIKSMISKLIIKTPL